LFNRRGMHHTAAETRPVRGRRLHHSGVLQGVRRHDELKRAGPIMLAT
jgi:hypothetical protein